MNHGSQSKITPGILINLINEHMPNSTVGIGRIDIRKNMSLFDVEASHQEDLIEAFKRTAYKGLIVRPDQGQNDQPERRFRKDEGSSRSSGSAYGSKKPTEKKNTKVSLLREGNLTQNRLQKANASPGPKSNAHKVLSLKDKTIVSWATHSVKYSE